MNDSSATTYVLFGSTGDLALRKILPALFKIFLQNPTDFKLSIVAYSRRPWTSEEYRHFIRPALEVITPNHIEAFLNHITYVKGEFADDEGYMRLKEVVAGKNALYHLAIQPEFYLPVINKLGEHQLLGKLLIEKPFGYNRDSALELEKTLEHFYVPEDIFRIDHYLGKSGLLHFLNQRLAPYIDYDKLHHPLESDLYNRLSNQFVALIHCRLLETVTAAGRGEFYDAVGAIRDVGQNHLLEMLATVLGHVQSLHDNLAMVRTRAIEQLIVPMGSGVAVGQYQSFLKELGVKPDSTTETYFRIMAESTDPMWRGVHLILEGGKGLPQNQSEIAITFKDGTKIVIPMELPGGKEAYQYIIERALMGDQTPFVSSDEIVVLWHFIDPIMENKKHLELIAYEVGTKPAITALIH